jgi:hypothetical protein
MRPVDVYPDLTERVRVWLERAAANILIKGANHADGLLDEVLSDASVVDNKAVFRSIALDVFQEVIAQIGFARRHSIVGVHIPIAYIEADRLHPISDEELDSFDVADFTPSIFVADHYLYTRNRMFEVYRRKLDHKSFLQLDRDDVMFAVEMSRNEDEWNRGHEFLLGIEGVFIPGF